MTSIVGLTLSLRIPVIAGGYFRHSVPHPLRFLFPFILFFLFLCNNYHYHNIFIKVIIATPLIQMLLLMVVGCLIMDIAIIMNFTIISIVTTTATITEIPIVFIIFVIENCISNISATMVIFVFTHFFPFAFVFFRVPFFYFLFLFFMVCLAVLLFTEHISLGHLRVFFSVSDLKFK